MLEPEIVRQIRGLAAMSWGSKRIAATLGSRLLTVSEVATQLGVCSATVYKLCADGSLRHMRVLNSIRVADAGLQAFIASRQSTSR
jgi:excisionase family DNA binding protein